MRNRELPLLSLTPGTGERTHRFPGHVRVLLVGANELHNAALASALEDGELQTEMLSASTRSEFERALARWDADLAIVAGDAADLPLTDALDYLRRWWPQLPVLAVVADAPGLHTEALAAGAWDVMTDRRLGDLGWRLTRLLRSGAGSASRRDRCSRAEQTVTARDIHRQELLARLGRMAVVERDQAALQEAALDVLMDGLAPIVDAVRLLRVSADGDGLELAAHRGLPAPLTAPMAIPAAGGGALLRQVVEGAVGGDLVAAGAEEGVFLDRDRLLAAGLRCALEVGVCGEAVDGRLGAYARAPHALTPGCRSFVEAVAHLLEIAAERRFAEDQLAQLAQYDPLTGLANRGLFRDRVDQRVLRAATAGSSLGVMLLEIEGLPAVIAQHGHERSDEVLREMASRLQHVVGQNDTVGRMSGSEFAIAWNGFDDVEAVAAMGRAVAEAAARPFALDEHFLHLSASRGIALYPGCGQDADHLLRNAAIALLRAKQQGRNGQQVFNEDTDRRVRGRMRLEADLWRALERGGEFVLYYQPQVCLRTQRTIGAEALLRWLHPDLGTRSPGDFLPVAEECGLMPRLGRWVLETACAEAVRWQARGHHGLRLAVNVSPSELGDGGLSAGVREVLLRFGVPAGVLEVELTEHMAIDGADTAVRRLHELKAAGATLAIDDFGTGFSNLAYLKRFPLDTVKLDRTFTADLDEDPRNAAIVRAIILMCHELGFRVIAEGVERAEQAAVLRECGCDMAQGYLYARPVPADEFLATLEVGAGSAA
jgi:diguanylate cyclase (GGDEF)-like protein